MKKIRFLYQKFMDSCLQWHGVSDSRNHLQPWGTGPKVVMFGKTVITAPITAGIAFYVRFMGSAARGMRASFATSLGTLATRLR
jgi:hypothetical protein